MALWRQIYNVLDPTTPAPLGAALKNCATGQAMRATRLPPQLGRGPRRP